MTRADDKGMTQRRVGRYDAKTGARRLESDTLVVEEPLEIRLEGETAVVTMRTPGEDHQLTLGFLLSEGLIGSLKEVGRLAHCGRPGDEGFGNIIDVTPAPGVAWASEAVERTRRGTLVSSACGVCGRQSIEDLTSRLAPIDPEVSLSAEKVLAACRALRDRQPRFAETGAIHGAGVIDPQGEFLSVAEDVGRHNAVDKVNGMELYRRHESDSRAGVGLVVSGRVSFEIVQKAIAARLSFVVGVSAPTSLAVELAEAFQVGVAGFARGSTMNLYAVPSRFS